MNYLTKNKLYKGNLEFLFAKISANMIHFFGNYSLDEHKEILYRYLSYKEESYHRFVNSFDYLSAILPNKSIIDEIDKSQIIYSYCIGEYRMLPVLLNQLGYNITILMAGRVKSQQSELFYLLNQHLRRANLSKQRIKFLTSEEDNVIWKLKSDIVNGNKVLVYIDGNSGVVKSRKNLVHSSFFSQTVYLHQGISYLSHVIKMLPLGIAIFYDKEFIFKTFKHNSIIHSDRNLFAKNLTIKMFSDLEGLLKEIETSKWDTLEGIHKWLDTENLNLENYTNGERTFLNRKDIEFNTFRYSPFYLGKDYFVFDKKQYLTYKIKKKDYKTYAKYIEL